MSSTGEHTFVKYPAAPARKRFTPYVSSAWNVRINTGSSKAQIYGEERREFEKHIYSVKKTSLQCLHAHTNQIVTVIQLVHNYQGSTSNFLENLLQSVSEIWPPPFIKDGQPDSYNQESNLMKVSDISASDVASGHRRLTIYVKAFGIFPQLNFPIGDVYDRRGK